MSLRGLAVCVTCPNADNAIRANNGYQETEYGGGVVQGVHVQTADVERDCGQLEQVGEGGQVSAVALSGVR